MTLGDRIHYLQNRERVHWQELGDKVGRRCEHGPQVGNGLHQNTSYRIKCRSSNARNVGRLPDGWTDNSVNVGTVGTNNGVIGQNSGEIHLEQQRFQRGSGASAHFLRARCQAAYGAAYDSYPLRRGAESMNAWSREDIIIAYALYCVSILSGKSIPATRSFSRSPRLFLTQSLLS